METQYSIKGTIQQANGKPLADIIVVAYDRDLRDSQPLGNPTETNHLGEYKISYAKEQFKKAERGSADIVVKVFAENDREYQNPLAVSDILFNAPAVARINLTVSADKYLPLSEYEQLARLLQPLHERLSPAELEEDQAHQDITFLTGEIAWERNKILRYALAHRLVDKSKIDAEFWYVALNRPILLEVQANNLADKTNSIINLLPNFSEDSVRQLLSMAFIENQINQNLKEKTKFWLAEYHNFVLNHLDTQTKGSTLKQVLEIANLKADKQKIALDIYLNSNEAGINWIYNLTNDKRFTPNEVKEIKTTFTLSDMTMGNIGLVKALKNEIGTKKEVRDLAKLSPDEWQNLVDKHGDVVLPLNLPQELAINTNDLQKQIIGRQISDNFRNTFSTVAFAGDLGRAMQGQNNLIPKSAEIATFLDKNKDFDFLTRKIDDFKEPIALKQELKGVQRLFKLTNDHETIAVLRTDGVHSAQQIFAMGEGQFVQKYEKQGIDREALKATYAKAANTHAAVMMLLGELKATANAQTVNVTNTGLDITKLFPNWQTLFGTADVCDCEHCRSVYSPAAYFADILSFLKHRSAKPIVGGTVKDDLFARRPDLGYLELSCDNANVELPYVDVVCEVLEEAVAPSVIFKLVAVPVKGIVSAAIIAEFAANPINIIIAPDANVNEVRADIFSPITAYTLRDDKQSFKIALDGSVSELHQTRGKVDELSAVPQYVNANAYAALKKVHYPMALPADYINKDLQVSLPFDFFNEEIRAYLKKHGINRWELMKTFQANPIILLTTPTDGDIAAEYFGISIDKTLVVPDIDEKTIILTIANTLNEQAKFWGESTVNLLDKVKVVNTFLNKTGLEYNDLLKLLYLSFINPAKIIIIFHDDKSCDTVQKHLANLDFNALDHIHRFLRFWRKLNTWEMWELNLVIQHPNIGNGKLDEAFLTNLKDFVELKNKLDFSVEETISLFGTINTESKFDEPFHDRTWSLYEQLFLNKKKTNPIDAAFEIAKITVPTEKIIDPNPQFDHQPTIMAALKLRATDLTLILNKEGLDVGNNTLNLTNISILYRHAMLMRALQMKGQEYLTWLDISKSDDMLSIDNYLKNSIFNSPQNALKWWETTPTEYSLEDISIAELSYVLQADLTSKAAPVEKDVAKFLTELRKGLSAIKKEFDPNQYKDFTEIDKYAEILRPLLQKTGRIDAEIDLIFSVFKNDLHQKIKVSTLAASPAFPVGIKIAFNATTHILSFEDVMSDAEKVILLGLNANIEYQSAINDIYRLPRLWVKYILPFVGSVGLVKLPNSVDFTTLEKDLADKISFDSDNSKLLFKGIMAESEKTDLVTLSADGSYQTAINALFNAPDANPDNAELWLKNTDIPPVQANGLLIFTTATNKLLAYFNQTLSDTLLNQQFTASLGIDSDLTEYILTTKFNPPATALVETFNNDTFITSQNAIIYSDFKSAFDDYYWLNRLSWLIKKLNIKIDDLDWLIDYHYVADSRDILDFRTLPIDNSVQQVSYSKFLNLFDLIFLQHKHSVKQLSVFEIIHKIGTDATYSKTNFATDMHTLHEEWQNSDVVALSTQLNLSYPGDYIFAETWQRLEKSLAFIQKLNGTADAIFALINPTVGNIDSANLKKMLHVSYSDEQWLELSKDVQNPLRNRKRDSLVAYLLSDKSIPANNPSIKWENANDLYAYYLLDVQMGADQTTSRLVQASGSVQLFVQRCFMGLEPNVAIDTQSETADTGWLQWQWMRKYRVWEANRKIFLYPENWFEPNLRKDKSPFFKDLENELLQNEVNQDNVETAFLNYIEKLDNVAQLEIAGFYYEEATDILHVFGRTALAEPHLYYYRNFDEKRGTWSAWTKVDVDITGDYLIPTMINQRLYLFWPVFSEVPLPVLKVKIPKQGSQDTEMDIENPYKTLKVQMAVSEFRNKKWQPKKISKDSITSNGIYQGVIDKSVYKFRPIDLLEEEGTFLIQCFGYSKDNNTNLSIGIIHDSFEVFGCKGIPELINRGIISVKEVIQPVESEEFFMKPKEIENRKSDVFAFKNPYPLQNTNNTGVNSTLGSIELEIILQKTPGIFKVTRPLEPSLLDKSFINNIIRRLLKDNSQIPEGLFSPFFYADKTRTFFVKPEQRIPKNDGFELKSYIDYKIYIGDVRKWFNDIANSYIENNPNNLQIDKDNIITYLKFLNYDINKVSTEAAEVIRFLYRIFADTIISSVVVSFYPLKRYHFQNFYHPFTCLFAKQVYNFGIDGLMKREVQLRNSELALKYYPKVLKGKFDFNAVYAPTGLVLEPTVDTDNNKDYQYYPMEVVDFTQEGSYSLYNWELFYHTPLMIAERLSQNQRFEEAQHWFHYIFNPLDPTTTTDDLNNKTTQKFWITKPFFAMQAQGYEAQRIDTILNMLSSTNPADLQKRTNLEKQVNYWRNNPFEPNVVAQGRQVAYQKAVVMKYIDNLVAWGDQLFRQDSMESINEATQLYVLAAEILGPRPRKVSPQFKPKPQTFNELEGQLDAFSNALVDLENLIPAFSGTANNTPTGSQEISSIHSLYFCIPQNDKLLGYWDTVADRLFKIRHCMNIDGVVRRLSLFEPVIDPAALVNAIAGGASLSNALADLNAPLPFYRFNLMLQKANELCGDVKSLGGALLAALEKKDGEALALLRQSHELKVLDAVREIKEKQIEDSTIMLDGLKKNKEVITIKRDYYNSREFINTGESVAMGLNIASTALDARIAAGYILAGGLKLIPNFIIGASGFGGSPHATVDEGGKQIGDSAENAVKTMSAIATALDKGASIANTFASYSRRKEDWDFQAKTASKELENIDKQIAGGELKIKIAEKELKNHNLQIENAKAVDEYMRSKYTNQELYEWMITQVSQVYFQSYQLAYDLAKRAEKCYQFELGSDKTYLQFGYWDSLKKGLLSGEKLQIDLRRLESAYLEQNRREFELTKHISLALVSPLALLQLKENGRTTIQLPEELFDLDYQGHYFRRVKSVSLSIPCVAGPYTTVNATLRLLKNEIRSHSNLTNGYAKVDDNDIRFRNNPVSIKAVATSTGQNDSGIFELNFRDERYLPFEGAGVISTWSIELTEEKALRQFDYNTISDIILHMKYTAREDVGNFRQAAATNLKSLIKDAAENTKMPLVRVFDIKHEFPNAYHVFKEGDANSILKVLLTKDRFPFFAAEAKTLKIKNVKVIGRFGKVNETLAINVINNDETKAFNLKNLGSNFGDELKFDSQDMEFEVGKNSDEWQLATLNPNRRDKLNDLYIAVTYDVIF